jgi:hypothetical protein
VALLLTVPVAVFVGTGVLVTVSASVRVARTEGPGTAVGPNAAQLAYVHAAS